MKVIKQSCSLIEGLTPYEHIERVGRTCYKSEDLITKGSAEKFVASLVKRKHWAMLEHYTLHIKMSDWFLYEFIKDCEAIGFQLTFFNYTHDEDEEFALLSGSFRAFYDLFEFSTHFFDNGDTIGYLYYCLHFAFPLVFGDMPITSTVDFSEEDLQLIEGNCLRDYFSADVVKKHLTHTIHFVTDRGVSHEFVRHRNCAFAQESTRYCNYSKDKFGNEITVINPLFFDTGMGDISNSFVYDTWRHSCEVAERDYFKLLDMGATPQQARTVLPNSLKTELIITCTEKEWQHIVNLRYYGTTGAPHPQIKEAMTNALPLLIEASEGRLK